MAVRVLIEKALLCGMVTGSSINRFRFNVHDFLIFPHDQSTILPLIDKDQKTILELVVGSFEGPITKIKTSSSGSVLIFKGEPSFNKVHHSFVERLPKTYSLSDVHPCGADVCYDIFRDKELILGVRFEGDANKCRIYVDRLKIPSYSYASTHFLKYLDRLVKRTDYRAGQAPWVIFRVSRKKMCTKVAWQEIAHDFESCILPPTYRINNSICNPLIPNQKVYFICEDNKVKAAKMMLYLNLPVAEAFVKLVAAKLQNGFIEHISNSVGHLPIPTQIIDPNIPHQGNSSIWNEVNSQLTKRRHDDVNQVIEALYGKSKNELYSELKKGLGTIDPLIEYGNWLNMK